MEVIYYLTTLVLFGIVGFTIAGIFKPTLWQRFLKKRNRRKMIAAVGFVLIVGCGLVIAATEPPDLKEARLARERASKEASLQAKQQKQKQQQNQTKPSEPKVEKKEVEEKQAIAFTKEQKNDPTTQSGKATVAQAGKDGEKIIYYEITYTDGKETSRVVKREAVTVQPVTEITIVGSYVTPAPVTQSSNTRTGAICNDGSRSTATGSGACSHHDGVARWLYD